MKSSLILSTAKDIEKMKNDKVLRADAIAAENEV
jgi:hypothetical protein